MKIAEGSTFEFEIIDEANRVLIHQDNHWVKIHIDDLQKIIKELDRISRGENENP